MSENIFPKVDLRKLYTPAANSKGEDNGQLTVIGGSSLFHGAPLFSLKIASRIVDMVFFASPEESVGKVAEEMKSKLLAFIWVPWSEVERYIEKSDAVLIGPGFMRFKSEGSTRMQRVEECDEECQKTAQITETLLKKFSQKRWVIDAGSLQTMDPDWIPPKSVLTPNGHEYSMLFGDNEPQAMAKKHDCVIVRKSMITTVYSADKVVEIHGGNAGLTKGGTGDVQSGLTAALLTKNDPFLAACAASFIVKASADELSKSVGTNYNADDLADKIPSIMFELTQG